MGEKFFITTSIAYANAAPHIGYAYEVVLADMIARYKRMRGVPVFFLTGTDEHGDKIVRAAQKEEMGPQAFVDKNAAAFQELDALLDVSYDDFIRTSDKDRHWPGAQALWKAIAASGDLYKGVYKGLYCVGCEAFITEKELTGGKCPNHDALPEEIEEENYFFRLSKYAEKIKEKITSGELAIIPESGKRESLALCESGLLDVSFSRPEGAIPWGIPVPDDQGHMMYVWCDALANYISALGYGRETDGRFKTFWPADAHILGKDIMRFHAIIWPAMLLSAGLPLPKTILVHGFLTSGGKKMSKSLGNVIDPRAFAQKYGTEALRYYFAREISPFEDGDFTEEKFLEVYNANLANGLGNLVSRTLKMATQYFNGEVVRRKETDVPVKRSYATMGGGERIEGFTIPYMVRNTFLPDYFAKMDAFKINQGADVVWALIAALDGYVTDHEPFKSIKEDKEKTENIIWNLLYGLFYVAYALIPLMPRTAEKIFVLLGAVLDENGAPVSFRPTAPESPLFLRK